jgi:hypothetical protein
MFRTAPLPPFCRPFTPPPPHTHTFNLDWSEGDKDGFRGNIGTVIRQDDPGYVKCIFDGEASEVSSLRLGVRDLYEVQLAFGDNASTPPLPSPLRTTPSSS